MPHYITRLAYNSADWRRPTADARTQEIGETYNKVHGFGHEDWLFRNEWSIDGWRYGFVQGVGRSHDKLVKAAEPFDLTLFTIPKKPPRCYVATIHHAEVLTDEQADWALEEFRKRGWISTMVEEIRAIGGNEKALGDAKWAKHVLNLRFRWENVTWADSGDIVREDDPVHKLHRYNLVTAAPIVEKYKEAWMKRKGSTVALPVVPYMRQSQPFTHCSPEHARMQAKLTEELKSEYPGAQIVAEEDFVDVSVRTDAELLLFELKSDLDPRSVIRQALGQILEYAFHPSRSHKLPVRLFIVGRRALSPPEAEYVAFLKDRFALPIDYRVIEI